MRRPAYTPGGIHEIMADFARRREATARARAGTAAPREIVEQQTA
jgi:hypothetical protein